MDINKIIKFTDCHKRPVYINANYISSFTVYNIVDGKYKSTEIHTVSGGEFIVQENIDDVYNMIREACQ